MESCRILHDTHLSWPVVWEPIRIISKSYNFIFGTTKTPTITFSNSHFFSGQSWHASSPSIVLYLWLGARRPTAKLHSVPATNSPATPAMAANVKATLSAAKYAHYIHQLLCSPPTSTLIWALAVSTKLSTIHGLTPAFINNNLPCSTATNKGHMCRHQSNTASMRNIPHKYQKLIYKIKLLLIVQISLSVVLFNLSQIL
jgi:hypothetical protein